MSEAAMELREVAQRAGQQLARWRFGRALSLIALAGLAGRLAARWHHGTAHYLTEGYRLYWDLARNLAAGHGYAAVAGEPTGFRVPAYPLFLLAVTGGGWHPWAMALAGATLGALTVIATGLIGRELFGRAAGLIAAAACAAYPYYLWHDTALQETALVTCLAAWASWALLRLAQRGTWRLALLAGGLLALAVLTRTTMLPFALAAALWAGWRVAALRGTARGAVVTGSVLAVLAAGLAPWLVHTHRVYGEYVLGSELGASLYAGADPLLFSAYPDGSVDDSRAIVFAALPPLERATAGAEAARPLAADRWLRQQAAARIAADPVGFAGRFGRKVWIAFRPLPSPLHGGAANLAYAAVWVPLLLLGLAGLWQSRANWRRDALFYAQFAAFIAITGMVWAQTAHRVFLDLYLMVFAAGLISRWLGIGARHSGVAAPV